MKSMDSDIVLYNLACLVRNWNITDVSHCLCASRSHIWLHYIAIRTLEPLRDKNVLLEPRFI